MQQACRASDSWTQSVKSVQLIVLYFTVVFLIFYINKHTTIPDLITDIQCTSIFVAPDTQ